METPIHGKTVFGLIQRPTVYPKKYAHGFALLCFVVVIHWLIFPYPSGLLHWHCGNLTIASNDCPSASKATLMNMDKYFMWIHYERLHNHNKAKHNKTVCIFLGIYCIYAYYHNYHGDFFLQRTDYTSLWVSCIRQEVGGAHQHVLKQNL